MAEGLEKQLRAPLKKNSDKETKMMDQTQKSGSDPIGAFNSECYKNRKGRIKRSSGVNCTQSLTCC